MIRSFIESNKFTCLYDVSLKKYNTYKIDCLCKYLVFPKNRAELLKLIKFLQENEVKFLVLGNGSNVIFATNCYDGVIIRLDKMNKMTIDGDIVEVEAGYSLARLSINTIIKELSGLEFACGIPGFVGASVAMNAGAYNSSLSEVVESILVLTPDYKLVHFSKEQAMFKYRDSFFKQHKDYIVLSCRFKLVPADKEEMLKVINVRRMKRLETQPLEYPSAGSVFRNPIDMHAGALIEGCGLKGYKLGGAMVSDKHANFIVNYANATGSDIVNLIKKIKSEVYKKYNVELVLEQIIVD